MNKEINFKFIGSYINKNTELNYFVYQFFPRKSDQLFH